MIRPAIAVLATALVVSGCSTSPQKVVFSAKTGLVAAEAGILTYDNLPRCSSVVTTLCSTQETAVSLAAGKDAARSTINAAESAVRNPATPKSALAQWAAAALKSVQALLASIPKGQ